MNEEELRAIVRTAIARHTGAPGAQHRSPLPALSTGATDWRSHSSHALYASLVNVSTACMIEPAVPCNHCNYCRSHGH